MPGEPTSAWQNIEKATADLSALRHFPGGPAEFWPAFLACAQQLTEADQLSLLIRPAGQAWRRLADWPAQPAPSRLLTTFFSQAPEWADRAFQSGRLTTPLDPAEGPSAGNFVIGARVALPQAEDCALVAVISEINERVAREAAVRLSLAASTPEFYQAAVSARQAAAKVEKLSSILELDVSVSGENRFLPTALVFCNGLAAQFKCERVSLGWLERGNVRLKAVSRTENFDRQMSAAQALEMAMEEALDQDNEIVWPAPAGANGISRDHGRFAEEQKAGNLASLPVRVGGKAVAVVTCERKAAPFGEPELQQLRLSCDLAGPRLAELHDRDRWFGARWAADLKERAAKFVGPEHTWAKILGIACALAAAALIFLPVPYRVEGTFTLRSDRMEYLSAPFDGYIAEVDARPGDTVKAGQPLLKFKTAELELDESFALADVNRYQREAEKARASGALADMRVAEAMASQAEAQLNLARYRLREATVTAPFDGVVIQGDLRERIGTPVKAADPLFQVARIDPLYAEGQVSERDVHEILGKKAGFIAFVARPKFTYPVTITAIEPAAVTKQEGNFFLVRCAVDTKAQDWWRPGMSGVCKFPIGNRSLGWILTHRTVDFLRLKLWW
jgi:hypothetical protein